MNENRKSGADKFKVKIIRPDLVPKEPEPLTEEEKKKLKEEEEKNKLNAVNEKPDEEGGDEKNEN